MASKRGPSAGDKRKQTLVPPRTQPQLDADVQDEKKKQKEGEGQLIIGAAELEALAEQIGPAVKGKGKKGKKFADQAYMLSLVDSINKIQEEQIQSRLGHEAEILKRLVRRDQVRKRSREDKKERVTKMKDKLRQKGKSAAPEAAPSSKGKGDHRGKSSGGATSKKGGSGGKTRRVAFAD